MTVYHYTDEVAFRGIVGNRELWATHVDCMNDPKEMRHALDVLELLLSANPLLAGLILKSLRKDLEDRQYGMFLIAFSEHPDRLSQWRGYGDAGRGYALGFKLTLGASRSVPAQRSQAGRLRSWPHAASTGKTTRSAL